MTPATLNRAVLVLDAGYQPVNVVTARRALVLVYSGRAVMVEESGDCAHSPSASWQLPRIIRLFINIAHRVYRTFHVQLNKKNLFARDQYTCQYCGSSEGLMTIDHVVPRSRRMPGYPDGGTSTWENCVTCCTKCNHRKGNRLPGEVSMKLMRQPREPHWLPPILFRRLVGPAVPESWKTYLYLR